MATHYELLGVAPAATEDEIRSAYRTLARRHHPDIQPAGDAAAAEAARRRMAALNTAWAVLGDAKARRAYDASIGLSAGRPRPVTPPADPGRAWASHEDDDELDGSGGPGDFGFDDPDAPPRPRRPSDLLVMVPVLLLGLAAGLFFFSLVSTSTALRTAGELAVVMSGVGFLTAPLFAMIRARSQPDP